MASQTVRTEGIEFEQVGPEDLAAVNTVAQCLDNQWVPPGLLKTMAEKGQGLADVKSKLQKAARREYIRALINSEQVVVNRAFLYNNPVVSQDYLTPGPTREAFKAILSEGIVVPYLYREVHPVEKSGFTRDLSAFEAWKELLKDSRAKCVRLSWDQNENISVTNSQLAARFHEFAQVLVSRDTEVLCRDLGCSTEVEKQLRLRLGELAKFSLDCAVENNKVSREVLYKKFVVANGSEPVEGRYDSTKPFFAEIKQILDLRYNTVLPDALGGYALTPVGSLARTALQEREELLQREQVTPDQILSLVRRTAFQFIQTGASVQSLGTLSLEDVLAIRATDEWTQYVGSLKQLLADPWQFQDEQRGAPAVYSAYARLAARVTERAAKRIGERRMVTWTPVIELVVDVAGAVMSVLWTPTATFYKLFKEVSKKVAPKAAPVVGRLIVRGYTELETQADLIMSVDFMRRRMVNAREQWEELKRQLSSLPGVSEIPSLAEQRTATINFAEDPNASS